MASAPTQVFVVPAKGRDAEIAQLKKMITEAGCEAICDKAGPAEFEKCLREAGVLVVLICPETKDDQTVNKLVGLASREGKRVVGIWLPAAKGAELPEAINRHGDAVITLDVESIRKSVCGRDPTWTTPNGKPRPAPKTPRHKG